MVSKGITHLPPLERKKHSPLFDLAIAIGMLKVKGQIKDPILLHETFIGALSLDGTLLLIDRRSASGGIGGETAWASVARSAALHFFRYKYKRTPSDLVFH
ncbi:magnesium chelatase domain-containing protein [Aeribacillus sp. FSL M8-0254]|uniref:magnesium chelatase domain-containing protein n=1 Tax=Aeribacillus sp. FSL M8-0254 TaxID=2954577 RepID=UPI0025A580CB|nr:magnesium chelatase domain-containing protein [Geobacillus stearothermophilus]